MAESELKYTQADLDFFSDNADEYFAKAIKYKEALEWLADQHHRTMTGSRLHDPEHIISFRDCPCLTCKKVVEVLDG